MSLTGLGKVGRAHHLREKGFEMILGLLTLCIVIGRMFPDTATAQWINTVLVERPLAWLSCLKRRDIIWFFVMVPLFLTAGEFIMVFGFGELFVLGMNLSLYFDAVLVTTAATIAATVATHWRGVRARLSTWRRPQRPRATRQIRTRQARRPKSLDDEEAPGWGAAYAFRFFTKRRLWANLGAAGLAVLG